MCIPSTESSEARPYVASRHCRANDDTRRRAEAEDSAQSPALSMAQGTGNVDCEIDDF